MRKTTGAVALVLSSILYAAAPASAATWSVVPSPNLTQFDNVLWGVDALSATSAWAVGRADTGTLPVNRPVIERWNGTRWAISSSPLPSGGGELRDVDATSATQACGGGVHEQQQRLQHVGRAVERQRVADRRRPRASAPRTSSSASTR